MTCPRCSSPVIHKPGSFLVIGTQSVLSYNRLFAILELDSTLRVEVGTEFGAFMVSSVVDVPTPEMLCTSLVVL